MDLTHLHRLDRSDPVQARQAWDTLHLVASAQGIINRHAPRLFIRFDAKTDDFWFSHLRSPGQWLADRPLEALDSIEALLRTFATDFAGLVVYTEDVAATSNLASTIAGVEDRLCLRHDPDPASVHARVLALDNLAFTRDILPLHRPDGTPLFLGQGRIPGTPLESTGSAKCDAYLWARQRYLDSKRCDPRYLAYYIDAYWLRRPEASGLGNATLTNHDYFISKRAFFFDLHVWEEESPIDDPDQAPGTDLRTLRALMRAAQNAAGRDTIIQIGGFTPWVWKYTDHPGAGGNHGGVDTEWEYARIISEYNGVMDADAIGFSGMANASFYMHFPLRDHYPQNPRPTIKDLERNGFLREDGSVAPYQYAVFYLGDYDSAAWLNYHVPLWWSDPARGRIDCAWAFNPNLDGRAPHVLDYVRTRQAPSDWFVSGDSGAGYLNPGMLAAQHRKDPDAGDGWDAWIAHNRRYYARYDLSITGFIIDGHAPGMGTRGLDAYLEFSPDGIVGQKIDARGLHRDTMPYIRMRADLSGSPQQAAEQVVRLIEQGEAPRFMFVRTILKSPSWHESVMEISAALNPELRYVDPYSFFLLMKTDDRRRVSQQEE